MTQVEKLSRYACHPADNFGMALAYSAQSRFTKSTEGQLMSLSGPQVANAVVEEWHKMSMRY